MNKYFRKLINLYLYKSDILLWWTTNLTNVFVLFAGISYEFRYSRAWNNRTILITNKTFIFIPDPNKKNHSL